MALTTPTNTLTAQTVSASFDQLLYLDSASGLVEATLKVVSTEVGKSAVQLDDERLLVKGVDTSNTAAFDVQSTGGTSVFKVNASTAGTTTLGTVTVGVDGTGHDVVFYSGTAGDNFTWDASEEKLTITGTNGQTALDIADGNVTIADDLSVDGTTNLDNTDIDGTFAVDGSTISLDATTSFNIDNTNTSNGVTINTATSGGPISIGHSTSETTVNDNLTVTGTTALNDDITVAAGKKIYFDSTDTYIYSNADDPEDLVIGADADIILEPDGNVGIGTTTPLQQLHIAGATPMIQLEDNNATNTPYCLIDCSDGNLALKADDAGETDDSTISLQVDGSAKMTVLANGNVGIGVNDPDALLEVTGDQGTGQFIAKFHHDGSTYNRHGIEVWAGRDDGATSGHGITYYFLANDGDGGAVGSIIHDTDTNFKIVASSDERLKENIADSKIVGLDIVNSIKVREFNWKKKGGAFDPAGFIAQEVAKVYPRAAVGDPDGDSKKEPMGVSDTSFIAPMIKAIQELSAKVTALENT